LVAGHGKWTSEGAAKVEREATGVLQLIFGTGHLPDVALQFLHDTSTDAALDEKNATPALQELISASYGTPPEGYGAMGSTPLDSLRVRFARHLLLCDMAAGTVPESRALWPAALRDALPLPESDEAVKTIAAAASLVEVWRQRLDFRAAFIHHAERVEAELKLAPEHFLAASLPDADAPARDATFAQSGSVFGVYRLSNPLV
jgi:hypothetical protein